MIPGERRSFLLNLSWILQDAADDFDAQADFLHYTHGWISGGRRVDNSATIAAHEAVVSAMRRRATAWSIEALQQMQSDAIYRAMTKKWEGDNA